LERSQSVAHAIFPSSRVPVVYKYLSLAPFYPSPPFKSHNFVFQKGGYTISCAVRCSPPKAQYRTHVCPSPKQPQKRLMFRADEDFSIYSSKLSKLASSCVMVSPPACKHLPKSFRLLPILHGPPINYQNSIIPLTWRAPVSKITHYTMMSAPRLFHQSNQDR